MRMSNGILFMILAISSYVFSNPAKYEQPHKPYYSQSGQDKYIDSLFKERRDLFFVDIGAHDGISFSNTYFFEKFRGWSGICIEPHSERFEELKKNRTAVCYKCCVSDKNSVSRFLKVNGAPEMLSGLYDQYDPRHFDRVFLELERFGGNYEIVDVQTRTINDILAENNVSRVDLLSVDTEGSEFTILKSIDFKRFDIKVIAVENNFSSSNFNDFLKNEGYKLDKVVGADEIYIKKRKPKH